MNQRILYVVVAAVVICAPLGCSRGGSGRDSGQQALNRSDSGAAAAKDDMKELQGRWEVIRYETAGKNAPEMYLKNIKMEFKNNRFLFDDGAVDEKEQLFSIDPAKNPKQITLSFLQEKVLLSSTETSTTGKPKITTIRGNEAAKGIYELKEGQLTICLAYDPREERPSEFGGGEKGTNVLMIMRRPGGAALKGEEEAKRKPDRGAVEKELKLLQGTWELVSEVQDGRKVERPPEDRVLQTIEGDVVTFRHVRHSGSVGKARLEVDPTKTPKTMDVIPAEKNQGPTFYSLYELEVDLLRDCTRDPFYGRPTEFTAREGSKQGIRTYRRVKDLAALEAADKAEAQRAKEAIEREFQLLQGTWQLVSALQDGRKVEIPAGKQVRLTIRGDDFDYLMGFGVSGNSALIRPRRR
jgi:uncharacterized protein (TIGR03067 family)